LIRAIAAAAVVAVLLAPAVALASPTPSPSLDTLLAEPAGSDFVPESRFFMALQGDFDVIDYLAELGSSKPSHTYATLKSDGFVSGYGRSWAGNRTNHLLLEAVVAFSGAVGAKRWLPEARSLDQNGSYFKGNFAIPGIDLQFGDHFANPATSAYADSAGFVKGNNFFIVYMYSPKDDMADFVAGQAKQVYDHAPASTIPPSQWPETAGNSSAPSSLGALPINAIVIAGAAVVVLVFVGLLAVLLLRRGRPTPAAVAAPAAIQMSADGYYWWDGQSWRDAAQSAPPGAQRSADGNYWWDGGKWRSMPRVPVFPPTPPPPTATAPEPTPPSVEPGPPAS
jgi:hypothetical protein